MKKLFFALFQKIAHLLEPKTQFGHFLGREEGQEGGGGGEGICVSLLQDTTHF